MNGGTNIVIADQIVTAQIYHQVLLLKSFVIFSDHRGNWDSLSRYLWCTVSNKLYSAILNDIK